MAGRCDGLSREERAFDGVTGNRQCGQQSGCVTLTEREREVLDWVAQGKTNWEIGAILHISAGTVRRHLENIYTKLNVHCRVAAVLFVLNESIANF